MAQALTEDLEQTLAIASIELVMAGGTDWRPARRVRLGACRVLSPVPLLTKISSQIE